MSDTNRKYEALFLFGTAASANLDGTLDRVRSLVTGAGGEPIVLEKFDERRLAYEIGKQKRGLYILCYYSGPPSSVAAIDREVRLSNDVLRHLVTSADHLNEAEMNAAEAQKYEPVDLDSERRPRRPRPEGAEGSDGASGDNVDAGDVPETPDDQSARRAHAETAGPAD